MSDEPEANHTPSQTPGCEFDADGLTLRFDAVIAGEAAAIPPVVDRIMAFVDEMRCAEGQEFEIRLAVSEALANAVIHGCKSDPNLQVRVCVECDPARGMLIVVRDPGSGFDPAQVPNPLLGEQIFRGGGRGVYLINQLMDEVRYTRGGSEIRMRKRNAGPGTGAEEPEK